MDKQELLILIGIITAGLIIINLLISIRISHFLKENKIQADIAHRRGIIFKYLKIYKEITVERSGRPGSLYYLFLLTFIIFMTILFAGIIISSF